MAGPVAVTDELTGDTYVWEGTGPTSGSTPRPGASPTSSRSRPEPAPQALQLGRGLDAQIGQGGVGAVEGVPGRDAVVARQRGRHADGERALAPGIDGNGPAGQLLGRLGVAPADEQLSGAHRHGDEPRGVVLALGPTHSAPPAS